MRKALRTKTAILAASSLLAATTAVSAASAQGEPLAPIAPTAVEAPLVVDIDAAVVQADEQSGLTVRQWALFGVAAGAFAGLVKLIGARRAAKAVAKAAGGVARATAKTAGGAVKVVTKAAGAPLKWVGLMFGFGLFILLGVGFYDIEWIAGLAVGAIAALGAAFGVSKLRRAWLSATARLPF